MSIITLFRWKDFADLADLVDFFLYFTQCVLETGGWCNNNNNNTYIALIRMRSKRFTSIVLQYDLEI